VSECEPLVSVVVAVRGNPEQVGGLLEALAEQEGLPVGGLEVVAERYSWHVIARHAHRVYQAIAATRPSPGPGGGRPDHLHIEREVIALAWRAPYWLAEWRSRDLRPQDCVLMTDQTNHTTPEQPEPPQTDSRGEVGDVAEAIDCARLAATAALGIAFDAEAAVGYAGRSMVLFAPQAVLKVYTHRAAERAAREVAGIAVAAAHAPHLRVASILGRDDVPGGLSWVATTRLAGAQPSARDLTDPTCAAELGRVAARMHAIPAAHLDSLARHSRRIRELPEGDPAAVDAGRALTAALDLAEPHQRTRCEHGFVHGDLSSRNILLAADQAPAVIDFEGSGAGCIYDDLATLVMQDGLLGPAEPDHLIAGYEVQRDALGHPAPRIDRAHLALHLGWRARWILQWAVEIDRPLTEQVLALAPALLADLARLRPRENTR
jgi:aminoglycoside phosphotransferase (APT) family kinase protein